MPFGNALTNKLADEAMSGHPDCKARAELVARVDRIVAGILRLAAEVYSKVHKERENELKDAEAACLEVNLTLSTTKESYLRLNADFDNFRKRTEAEGRGD